MPPLDDNTDPASAGMAFPLFKAPLRNISNLLRDINCSVCNQHRPYAFSLSDSDSIIRPCLQCGNPVGLCRGWKERPPQPTTCTHCGFANPWPSDRPDAEIVPVCYECLRAGRVAIHHETESFNVNFSLAVRGMASLNDPDFATRERFATTVLETFDDGSQSIGVHLPQSLLFELLRSPVHQKLQREYWPWHCRGLMAYVGRWEPDDFDRQAGGEGYEWFIRHLPPDRMDEAEDMWSWLEGGIAWSCVYQCQSCGLHRVYVDAD
jgi:uncharacterized protein CbrC (UPF0167 family)